MTDNNLQIREADDYKQEQAELDALIAEAYAQMIEELENRQGDDGND